MNPEPLVNAQLHRMNALQRSTESFCYVLLSIEQSIAPDGQLRNWLRQNVRVGAWLFIPAVFVMPAVGLILWQLTGWMTIITLIFGHLIVLPILILLVFGVFRIVASFRR